MIHFPPFPQNGKLKDNEAVDLCLFSLPQSGKIRLECQLPGLHPDVLELNGIMEEEALEQSKAW